MKERTSFLTMLIERRIFGNIHYSAVSKVVTKFKEELAGNKELSNVMKRLESNIKT